MRRVACEGDLSVLLAILARFLPPRTAPVDGRLARGMARCYGGGWFFASASDV